MTHVTDNHFWDNTGKVPLTNLDLIYLFQVLLEFNSSWRNKLNPSFWAIHLQKQIAAYFAKYGISKMPDETDLI